MKNAMLTKILAKFIKNNPHINPEDLDLDGQDLNEIDISELQLYDELEDFAISDEDDEIFDDDVSIRARNFLMFFLYLLFSIYEFYKTCFILFSVTF